MMTSHDFSPVSQVDGSCHFWVPCQQNRKNGEQRLLSTFGQSLVEINFALHSISTPPTSEFGFVTLYFH